MPSGRMICFVCGSLGAETTLNIKPQERGPYFPFLENHDPPKGCRLPKKDGRVDSCRVCYMFLSQQWETYERSRTPAIKRLYWLKRSDNGHFTGAEMRIQGEYIAQVMGLQYQPGVFDGGASPGESRPDNCSPVSVQRSDGRQSSDYIAQPQVAIPTNFKQSQGSKASFSHESRHLVPQQGANNSLRNIDTAPQRSALADGALDLSVTTKKMPEGGRLKLSHESESIKHICCFICTKECGINQSKLVSTCRQPTSEPYFPVLGHLPQANNPNALTKNGQVRVCLGCKNLLYQQWQAYEMSGIPMQHRTYKLYDDVSPLMGTEGNGSLKPRDDQDTKPPQAFQHVCYLCGHLYPKELIQPLYTIPPCHQSLGTLFFPFIRDLQRPQGAHPLKSDGTVLACRNCFGDLYQQWQVFEAEGAPLYRRPYSLSFLSKKITSESGNVVQPKIKQEVETNEGEGGPSSSSSDVSQPLNIQITESSTALESSTSKSNTVGSQGLLAIATQGIGSVASNLTSSEPPSWSVAEQMKKQQNQEQKSLTVPHPLQQVSAIPKKICFLCGTKSRISKMHVLCSYPTRHEAKGANSQIVPFFPFLANRDPAPKAESMSEDGTVMACNICYHALLKQWNEQEESKNPAENNRWLRKYTVPEMIGCYVCSKNVKRRNTQIISIAQFPSLKDHPVPANALVVDGGEGITACGICSNSLGLQYAEFERMGVPIEMRKYNWVNASQSDAAEDQKADNQNEQDEGEDNLLLNVDENSSDSQGSGVDMRQTDNSTSLGQGSKPPPLTMISPAGAKLSRNTATVPPLNQVSPSNGVTSIGANAALNATRTSSFAAALRKLAHQAKDPEEGNSSKHPPTPGSSSTSPRAVTPKRGPPPLVYSSHSSSLTSPPVVTIAPTQSHPTLVSSEAKQSLERAHSVQSTASSAYDPLSIKQDRDRPQSTHSNRDDDRSSLKDATQSRRPHSGHSSTSPAASREELSSRGFQPYRPGEDLRHQLPPTMFGLDPSAYPYPTAFMPSHFPHPAFRFDDPVLLERYRMMQPPYLQFPHPGMIPPPGVHPFLAAGSRYPSELLHQQFAFGSQSSRLGEHISPALSERQRLEEERLREMEREKEREREREREREKEREAVLQRERERAREREKEYDKEKARDLYYTHQAELRLDPRSQESRGRGDGPHGMANQSRLAKAEDSSGSKYSSTMHGSQRDLYGDRTEKVHPYNDHPPRMEADRDKYGRESNYDDRRKSDIHPHSSEQSLLKNLDKHEYEKRAYSLAFADKQNMVDKERHPSSHPPPSSQYSSLHHADLAHKTSKDFFRPFDTANILTNGFNGSHDYDKYSVHYSKASDRTSKSPAAMSRSSLEASQERRAILEESVLHNKGPRDSYLSHRRMSEETMSSGRKSGEESLLLRSTEELQRRFSGVDRRNRRTPEEVSSGASQNEYKHFLNNNILLNMEKNNQDSKSLQKEIMSDSSNCQGNSNLDHKSSTALPSTFHYPYVKHIHSVVSRLDTEERKLREKRQQSDYDSDDTDVESDDEEIKRQRLLFIRSGPPLPLDTSKPKIKFLKQLGLTSQRIKRDLDHQKMRKRRRSLRERSVSPVQMVGGESAEEAAPSLSHSKDLNSDLNSDALCQERDYPEKCSFLSSMKLSTISPDKKKGLKRKSTENSGERIIGSKMLLLDKEGGKAKSRHSLMPGKTFNTATDKTAILFPNKNKKKMLSREFAQEFHESVLQTTRQKELNSRLAMAPSRPVDMKMFPGKGEVTSMSRLVSNSGSSSSKAGTSAVGSAGCRTDHDTNGGVPRWPGIDSLLEAYQNHSDELKLERSILMDRCQHLQTDNQDLNRTAESLSKRMAELIEQKRLAANARSKLQESLDSLKKCTRDIR
ncbi:genetic suppressor element 1-like isoform X2 [Mizuhopecten yessoensis]|uniref:genetic suppressor element 1-like isoform X2 n=1 Tax=Mizuhopecten yessoensis TaxID=6573 RepID=UPI000B45B537|nr:genetic suppressor element 1-like isoform X2 [Mizuhopecten yessoensis]